MLTASRATSVTSRRRTRPLLATDDLFVGARTPGVARVTYWDGKGTELAQAVAEHATRHNPVVDEMLRNVTDTAVRTIDESWTISDRIGPMFTIRRYRAADHPSYDVVADDGGVLATFFCDGGVIHQHVIVRDDAAAPVAAVTVHHHVHELRMLHGDRVASCNRVRDPLGNDTSDEVWHLHVEPDTDLMDRRALVAMPLVCHLMAFPKRHIDPDCTLAVAALVVVPPVGAVAIAVERAVDGVLWLRRRLD